MTAVPLPDDFGDPMRPGPASSGATAIRCPACRREHLYEPPSLPCPCGAQLRVPLLRGGVPVQIRFRSWDDSWLSMRCPHCGRNDQWPQPEFTCDCGATVRLAVDRTLRLPSTRPLSDRPSGVRPWTTAVPPSPTEHSTPARGPRLLRPPFRPQPVHSANDAVLTAVRYLQWLGFDDLELTDSQEDDAVTLLGSSLVARVDTWTQPAEVKAVECLWLETLHTEEVAAVLFATAGFSRQATVRGEQLVVALFTLDASGIPQPANGAAEALMETGWTS